MAEDNTLAFPAYLVACLAASQVAYLVAYRTSAARGHSPSAASLPVPQWEPSQVAQEQGPQLVAQEPQEPLAWFQEFQGFRILSCVNSITAHFSFLTHFTATHTDSIISPACSQVR